MEQAPLLLLPFKLLSCFHWQQSEGGLQNRQRCEAEDKSTETKEELNYVFLFSDKAKKITNNRESGRSNDGIILD